MSKTLRTFRDSFTNLFLTFPGRLKLLPPVFILTIICTSVNAQDPQSLRKKKLTDVSQNDQTVARHSSKDSLTVLKKRKVANKPQKVKTLERGKAQSAKGAKPRSVND